MLGAAVAAASAVAAATAYVTRSIFQVAIERQSGEITDLTARYDREVEQLTNRCAELDAKYREALTSGSVLSQMKADVEREFALLADRIAATAGSVFIPAPSLIPSDKPSQLIFFTALGSSGAVLRRQRIPIAGTEAGRAFLTQTPSLSGGASAASSFSSKTDQAANFETRAKLSVPLFRGQLCVGVAQLLNKQGDADFTQDDLDTVVRFRDVLGARVGELTRDPDNLVKFGITPSADPNNATVMFSDISNSSQLARQIETAQFVDMLNQYCEELGEVALKFGGTIDQFLGDGFMVTFNAKRRVDNHELKAVQAALEMQKSFDELKRRWVALAYPGASAIFNRIAIGAGPIRKAEMGHPQCKQVTVMGSVVNDTHHLCELGDRTRDVVVIDRAVREKLSANTPVESVSAETGQAFELKFAALPVNWNPG